MVPVNRKRKLWYRLCRPKTLDSVLLKESHMVFRWIRENLVPFLFGSRKRPCWQKVRCQASDRRSDGRSSRTIKICVVLLLLGPASLKAVELDSPIEKEVFYEPRPKVHVFSPQLVKLWIDALGRPENEVKRQIARDIARAHRLGMPGLEQAIPSLVENLAAENVSREVAFDTASALVELDARDSAGLLMQRVEQGNLSIALLIEPVLADWGFAPMREVWLARLGENDIDAARMELAIEGLRVVKERQAIEPLRGIALDSQAPSVVRLQAARALGQLRTEGGESDADALLSVSPVSTLVDRLVAARLLRYHRDPKAVDLLVQITGDPSGAVQAVALSRLVELDASLAEPLNEQIAMSPDANVRQLAAEAFSEQQTVEAVGLLGRLLDDPIPSIRRFAADRLVELDKIASLQQTVRLAVTEMLRSGKPRGVEQAAMVAGAIDHEAVAGQLVELLESEVPPVAVGSAWALRKLAVPETAEAILAKIRAEADRTLALDKELWRTWSQRPPPVVDYDDLLTAYRQLEQLIQALGAMRMESSRPLLESFLPTPLARGVGSPPAVAAIYNGRSRAAAIWALAKMSTDETEGELSDRLLVILDSAPPGEVVEEARTRAAAAVGLRLMKIQEAVPGLRSYIGPMAAHDTVGATCARCAQELAGDELPKAVPLEVRSHRWFLAPLE